MKRVLIVLSILASTIIGAPNPAPAQTPANHTPGVGYTHAWMTDPGQNNASRQVHWWFPLNDTTGLPQASLDLTDGNVSYGTHLMPGVHAGGFDRITGQHPIITFSHGTKGAAYQNYSQFTQLARDGYIVVAIDHIGHNIIDVGLGSPIDGWPATNVKRNLDMKFAINSTLWIFGNKVKREAPNDPVLITMGHSMGGMTALTVPTGLNGYLPADPRVDAVIAIAPSAFTLPAGGIPLTRLNGLTIPVLILESRSDVLVSHSDIDSIIQNLPFVPFSTVIQVPLANHNATADVIELNASVQASATMPQAVKDWLTTDVSWICHPSAGPLQACQDKFHRLQNAVVGDFLDMAGLTP